MDVKPERYDTNFCFPIPDKLESERVKLTPFVPSKYLAKFIEISNQHPQMFKYLALGPFKSAEHFLSEFVESRVLPNSGITLFTIFDKTKIGDESPDGALAGIFSYLNSSAVNLATEIGWIMILPPFQRTHVTSNAVGLLLHYALDLPAKGGLGLRRVFWQANSMNKPSVRLAERMGLKMEGILRWDRVLNVGKEDAANGGGIRDGDPRAGCVGRDTAMLSMCWDDWENGGREHVDVTMARLK